MPCSPMYMLADLIIWSNPYLFPFTMEELRNFTTEDHYDCALSVVPCENNITRLLVTMNPRTIFWFDLVTVYIVLTVMFCLGVFGNVVNIVILSTNNIASDSTNNLLLMTSISDLMHCLCLGIGVVIPSYMCFFDAASALSLFNYFFIQMYQATKWFGMLSLDFIVVLSIQRAAAIILPFRVSTIFSNRNTNIIIAILVTAIPIHLSGGQARKVYHPYFGRTLFLGYYFNSEVQYGVYVPLYMSRLIVNLSLLLTTASVTVNKLNKHVKNRQSLKAGKGVDDKNMNSESGKKQTMSTRELNVIRMSIAICFTSFVVYLIVFLGEILFLVSTGKIASATAVMTLNILSKVSGSVVCAFNFFLYIIMSSKFRETFMNILKCNFTKPQNTT